MQELLPVLTNLDFGIILVDSEGVTRFINGTAQRMLELAPDEVWEGCKVREIQGLHDVIPLIESYRMEEKDVNIGRKWFRIKNYPLKDWETINGSVLILNDISEAHQLQEEMRELRLVNKELETVLENLNEGMLISDQNGRILRANKAMEKITGLKKEDYIGKTLQQLFENKVFLEESVTLKALKEHKVKKGVQRIDTGTEIKYAIVTAYQIFDEQGQLFRLVSNVQDISEVKALKDQLDQAQLRSTQFYSELTQLRLEKLKENLIITKNNHMSSLLTMASRVAKTDASVLLLGESGVGKGAVAQMILHFSNRCDEPFISVNCGAIPGPLLESEMFGYDTGAFTGAKKQGKPGLFELAHNGTLFLDEVGELSLELQVKLLKVLQDQKIRRVGGTEDKLVDVRIIAATNRDLEELVRKGQFREDLYYRLNVVPIKIPPVRERKEDIPLLVSHFLKIFNGKYSQTKSFSQGALELLIEYNWPGNVRELANLVERLVITVTSEIIDVYDLPEKVCKKVPSFKQTVEANPMANDWVNVMQGAVNKEGALRDIVNGVEREIISKVCNKTPSLRQAAKLLGLSHSALLYKLEKYGIRKEILASNFSMENLR